MAAVASPPTMAGEPMDKVTVEEEMEESNRVLTPPTSEDMNKHDHDDNSSELSELEEDNEAEVEEIKPDHYWDEENGGRIPVFKPTMDQFRDFKSFVDRIDHYGMQSGIVKVVPPKEWRGSLPELSEAIKSIRVKNPITQEFAGTHGTYTQANIEKQRSYNLPQWKTLCEESNHKTPARKGDRRREAAAAKAKPARANAPTALPDGQKRRPGRPRKNAIKTEDVPAESIETDLTQVPPTPTSPDRHDEENDVDVDDEELTPSKGKPGPKPRGRPGRKPGPKAKAKAKSGPKGKPGPKPGSVRQPRAAKDVKKSVASRRLNNTTDVYEVDEEAFEDFDYHLEGADQFDVDRCRELEETYWKTLNFGTPMYGADMPGSLFDERTKGWNVANLENLLDVLHQKLPGVNTAYLYLGMWKATFAWHLEDVDLYSINYIHFGAPKQWYSISQADARKFEAAMRTLWPQDYKHCDQFLRHKTYLISPEKLKSQFGIKVNKLVHYEGEFVITYPYGYHSGFNLGYNCAESVNFATEAWLNYGRIAKKCLCEADSVWVDVNEIERKLRGEPTPEYYEVTDDDSDDEDEVLPTPPPSVVGKKTAGRKRKRPDEKPKDTGKRKVKRLKLRLRAPSKEPCILCPNDVKFDVLLPTDNGRQAHRLCALYTPETYLVMDPVTKSEKVCNVSHIDKARLELKCNYCRSKKGSCFQCASKKCTRAFHATCAAAAGVLVDEGPVPTWDEDGTEYFFDGFDFRCRFHRPRRPKNNDGRLGDGLENNKLITKYAKTLKLGECIQAQCLEGDIFAGVVVENRPSECTVILDIEPLGDRIELEYKYILVLEESQSQRPKPSPDAKPLPEHLTNTDTVSATNRQDGVPSKGDPFMDPEAGQKWEEFNAVHTSELKNPFQKTSDLSKPDQLWHYLGKTSTEAKPQYSDDLNKTVHNQKSNFLDTVKEAPQRVALPPKPPYPTSYANYGPSSAGLAPRPMQPVQPRPPADRPYAYKPKLEIQPNGYRNPPPYQQHSWQAYPSPIQHQHRKQSPKPPQYPYSRPPSQVSSASPPVRPQGSPPSSYGFSKPTPVGNLPKVDNGPPLKTLYQQAERQYSRQQPMEKKYQNLVAAPSLANKNVAPVANMLGPASSLPNMPTAESIAARKEYIDHISGFPFLRNAFMRRPETYVSPYAVGGGFSPEYESKLQRKFHEGPSTSSRQDTKPLYAVGPAPQAPMMTVPQGSSTNTVQYQTPQDFKQKNSQEQQKASSTLRHEWSDLHSKVSPPSASSPSPPSGLGHNQNPYAQHSQSGILHQGISTAGNTCPLATTQMPASHKTPATPVVAAARPIDSKTSTHTITNAGAPPRPTSTDSGGRSVYDSTRSPPRPDYSPISAHATPVPAIATAHASTIEGHTI